MKAPMLAWMLSLTGAALFFAAGVLFALYRAARARDAASLRREGRAADTRALSDARASGDVLRAILDREAGRGDLTGAVIADELGLVVAATGEFADLLAAYGAALVGIGTKTREALPLTQVRKVVVEDERDMVLTVRPLATADAQFSLVTLTAGQTSAEAFAGTER